MAEDPVPIRNVLLDRARSWGLDNPLEIAEVFGSWATIVGEQVAARCEPASLGRGVLKVWAASPAWANELRYLAPEVIRRVNASLGGPVVRELKVSLRPPDTGRSGGRGRLAPAGQEGRKPPPTVAAPPAPPPSDAEVDKLVGGIGDPDLASAVKRAFLAARTRTKRSEGSR